jgi:hypothetical protein
VPKVAEIDHFIRQTGLINPLRPATGPSIKWLYTDRDLSDRPVAHLLPPERFEIIKSFPEGSGFPAL